MCANLFLLHGVRLPLLLLFIRLARETEEEDRLFLRLGGCCAIFAFPDEHATRRDDREIAEPRSDETKREEDKERRDEDSISVPGTDVPPTFHSRYTRRVRRRENVVTEFINTFRALRYVPFLVATRLVARK